MSVVGRTAQKVAGIGYVGELSPSLYGSSPTSMPIPTSPASVFSLREKIRASPLRIAAAGDIGPADEFFGDRRYVAKDKDENWRLCAHLTGETSDEEGLPWASHCSVCGSDCCRRKPGVCKEQDRLFIASYLTAGIEQCSKY